MGKILISREKTEEIQNVYQRKYSVNDLCVLLASKNELIKALLNDSPQTESKGE